MAHDGALGPAGPAEEATGATRPATRDVFYVASVADGGSDANDGASWATPKATVYAAWNALGPNGGDIYVLDGAHWNPDATVGLQVAASLTGLDVTKIAGDPVPVQDAGGVRVFARGSDGHLLEFARDSGGNWNVTDHSKPGDGAIAGDPVPVQDAGGVRVFARGSDGHLLEFARDSGGNWNVTDHSKPGDGAIAGDPVPVQDAGGVRVFARGSDGHLLEFARDSGGNWKVTDHSKPGDGAIAGDPVPVQDAGGVRVFARGSDGHLLEFARDSGGNWKVTDHSKPGDGAIAGDPVPVQDAGGVRVFARGSDGHLLEFARDSGGNWKVTDHSKPGDGAIAGDPVPVQDAGGVRVFARGSDGHLLEFARDSGGNWKVTDHSKPGDGAIAGDPVPVQDAGGVRVFARGSDGHLLEFARDSGGNWKVTDHSKPGGTTWLLQKSVTVQGVARKTVSNTSRMGQARIYGGSNTDRNKPAIWIAGTSQPIVIRDVATQFLLARPILIGTQAGNAAVREGEPNKASGITLDNVGASCQDGADNGPCVDIGFAFWIDINNCSFQSNYRATEPTPSLTAAKFLIPQNQDINNPFAKAVPNQPGATFTAGDRFILTGQTTVTENGIYVWNDAVTKVVPQAAASVNDVIAVRSGRYAGAFMKLRTTNTWDLYQPAADRNAGVSTYGGDGWTLTINNLNTIYNSIRFNCPPSYYRAAVKWLTAEGPGCFVGAPAVSLIGASSYGQILCENIQSADIINEWEVYVDPRISPGVTSAVMCSRVYNATSIGTYVHDADNRPASSYANRIVGFADGHVYGQADHARRQFGPAVVRSPNLVKYDPSQWPVGLGTVSLVAGPDGSMMAGQIRDDRPPPGSGSTWVSHRQLYRRNLPLAVGDHLIAGVWAKPTFIDDLLPRFSARGCGIIRINTDGFAFENGKNYIPLLRPFLGEVGEWQWVSCIGTVSAIGANEGDTSMDIGGYYDPDPKVARTRLTYDFYGPVLFHLPKWDPDRSGATFTTNEAYEIYAALQSLPDEAPVGSIAALLGQTGYLPGHLVSQGRNPIAVGSAHTTYVTAAGSDVAGRISITVDGTGTSAGVLCTVTFSAAYALPPRVLITPATAAAAAAGAYVTATLTTFTISTGALAAASSCIWDYHVIQ